MKFKKGEHVRVTDKSVLAKELQEMNMDITGIIENSGKLKGNIVYVISLYEFEKRIQIVPEKFLERVDMVA